MNRSMQAELKQRKPFALPQEELFLSLVRTVDLLGRRSADLLKTHDLSPPQYNVMRILRGAGEEGLPCGEISTRMVTRDPDITRLLDRLEKRDLVIRSRDKSDRRVITTRITKSGLGMLSQLDMPVLDVHRLQLGHLSRKDIDLLLQHLESIREKMG